MTHGSQEQSQDLTPIYPNSESSIFYIHELVMYSFFY